MSKYRLCYLTNGAYNEINISKLYCLKDKNVTDIKTIDDLTTSFKNESDLIEFLFRNKIIDNKNIALEITIDKKVKETGKTYFKPIYNSNKLLYKSDSYLLCNSVILKNIREHIYDGNYMYNLALNYEEKYKNAYNRISGSSTILSIIYVIKHTASKIKLCGKDKLTNSEKYEYENAIRDLYRIELYKYDTIREDGKTIIEIKKDKNGKQLKNYRGLHDLVNLVKVLDKDLIKLSNEELEIDNEEEEFLTMEDFRRVNTSIALSYKIDEEPIIDGNDYFKDYESRQELFRDLQRSGRQLVKKGDGDHCI